MKSRLLLPAFITLLMSSVAHAGFYIEPFAGYHSGNIEYTVKDTIPLIGGSKDKGTMNGPGFGLGLGWHFDFGLLLGIEAYGAQLTAKYDTSQTTAKWNQTAGYLIIGYQATKEGHVYVGLGGMGADDDQTPQTKVTGGALKAGIGYEFVKHLALNVEYVLYTPTDSETGSTKTKFSDIYERYQYTGYIINIRAPFEIGGKSGK